MLVTMVVCSFNTHKDVDVCFKCQTNRFVDGSSTIPWKVLRLFLLIPRLIRMYRSKSMAELLTWHSIGASLEGLIQNVTNSIAWKHINEKWPEFVIDTCNVRLGLALDGVNPFGDLSSCHSTWPVVLLNYNLLPWLVTKRYFLMLAFIIPSKESCTSINVDVYL